MEVSERWVVLSGGEEAADKLTGLEVNSQPHWFWES